MRPPDRACATPTASDLRTVLTVMRIAGALERCGDYAKNLAKRATLLNQMPAIDGAAGSVRRLAKSVVQLLKDALDAHIARDAAEPRMCASAIGTSTRCITPCSASF